MQQKTDFEVSGAKVVVELAFRVPVQALGGLDLQDELLVHDHVETLSSNLDPVVTNDCVEFPGNTVPSFAELELERTGVDVLAETESQLPMDREDGSNDGAGEFLVDEFHSDNFNRVLVRGVIGSLRLYPAFRGVGEALLSASRS